MENIFLTKDRFDDASSLPITMHFAQYNSGALSVFDISGNTKEITGTIADKMVAFSIDCRHKCIKESAEDASFASIIKILKNLKDPTIGRNFISRSFYILDIDDYSHQAMTAGFTDFVPMVFINGYKVQQRHVGLLKVYTTRHCYILIDKTSISDWVDKQSSLDINIIISFKRNIEKITTNSIINEKDTLYNDKYDYLLFSGNKIKTKDNYLYADALAFDVESELKKQGKTNEHKDYFSQVFIIDYANRQLRSNTKEFSRSYDTKVVNTESGVYSNQSAYEFIEGDGFNTIERYYTISYPDDFMIFKKLSNGMAEYHHFTTDDTVAYKNNRITSVNIANDGDEFELIPFYNADRHILINGLYNNSISSLSGALMKTLSDMKIYNRKYLRMDDSAVHIFVDGLLISINSAPAVASNVSAYFVNNTENRSENGIVSDDQGIITDDLYPYRKNSSDYLTMYENYTNPYVETSNIEDVNWINASSGDLCLYRDDEDSNIYFKKDDSDKIIIYVNGHEVPEDTAAQIEKLKTDITSAAEEDDAQTKTLRENILKWVMSSNLDLSEKAESSVVSVTANTSFIYALGGTNTITITPDGLAGYSYKLSADGNDNGEYGFIILPCWGSCDTTVSIAGANDIYVF